MFVRQVTKSQVAKGCQAEFKSYLSGNGQYKIIADNCGPLRRGLTEPIPGVQLVLAATLNTLAQPAIQANLPKEISERQAIAIKCADKVSRLMKKRRNRPAFIETYAALFPTALPLSRQKFNYKAYTWRGLAGAAFSDVCVLAGGGARVLKEAGIDEEPAADILKRSSGLLIYSRVPSSKAVEAKTYLGYPYAEQRHYVIKEREEGYSVDFTDEAKDKLQSWYSLGQVCPARGIPVPDGGGQNLMSRGWMSIIDYMVPVDATTSDERDYLVPRTY